MKTTYSLLIVLSLTSIVGACKSTKSLSSIESKKKVIYEIKAGDNLFKIAQKHQVKVEDLKTWNNMKDTDVPVLGQKLNIYISPKKAITYKVQAGDNLFKIAQKHQVKVEDLKTWNNMKDTDVPVLGQVLKIYVK